jgi:hypothetical protein
VALGAIPPAFALTFAAPLRAENDPAEHTIVLGAGGAGEVELKGGAFHAGVNVMVEWEAIENSLELELDVSVLSADGGVDVPIGLLAKKPFRLAPWVELTIGIGPEVVQVSNPTTKATFFGGQLALDLMLWPTKRVGFWVEPSYDVVFRDGLSHGLGTTAGVLLGW